MLKIDNLKLNHLQALGVVILLSLFLVVSILSVQGRSVTTDEPSHFDYGLRLLDGNPERVKLFDDSKMPFSALNALPTKVARKIPFGWFKSFLNDFNTARYMTILFSLLVAVLIYYWSRSLYGTIPALVSLFLYVFDPNIIAHSQLVTTDIYLMGTVTYTFYFLWRFAHQRSFINGFMCALALGIAYLAKYTSVVLLPLCFSTLFIYDTWGVFTSFVKTPAVVKRYVVACFSYFLAGLTIVLFIINIGFLFDRTLVKFGDYKFRSTLFNSIQQEYPILKNYRVPVPYSYLDGLDWVLERESGTYNAYLLGQIRRTSGFAGYFFVASFFKMPITTQITIAIAFIVYLRDKSRSDQFINKELFFGVPFLFFSIYFNFFYATQIGIRYYLVVFPCLYIFAGSLFTKWNGFSVFQKIISLALGLYLMVSVLSYHPYYLTYFNEFVWNKTQTYKYLADSNIDWGQSKNELNEYLAQHPDAVQGVEKPSAVHLIININRLVGVVNDSREYKWLRENFEPSDTLANNYLIYKITPKQIRDLCKNSPAYCK